MKNIVIVINETAPDKLFCFFIWTLYCKKKHKLPQKNNEKYFVRIKQNQKLSKNEKKNL